MNKKDIAINVIPVELQDESHKEATLQALASDFYHHMKDALKDEEPGMYEFGLIIKKLIKE